MPSVSGTERGKAPRSVVSSPDASRAPLDGRRSRDREVIETAVRLFSEKGYASTSVQDVADALGMLKGSLYYYIDTKETLLRKIFEDSHAEVSAIAEAHRHVKGSAIENLARFLHEYAFWYLTHLQRASLFAREWRHSSPDVRIEMTAQRRYYDEVLKELIESAREEGAIDADLDIQLATYFIMSAVSSLPDWFSPDGKNAAKDVASSYAQMAIMLLAPR